MSTKDAIHAWNASYTHTLVSNNMTWDIGHQMLEALAIADQDELKIHKLFPEAHLPVYGSEWAACFDLSASIREDDTVAVYGSNNTKTKRPMHDILSNGKPDGRGVTIYSGERCLVPTGLVFDLNESQSLRIHPRSGLSWKCGITVANCEGIVDADYVNETFVMLHNISCEPFAIKDGMRVAQGEIVQNNAQMSLVVVEAEPKPKTDRKGGFGSTGV